MDQAKQKETNHPEPSKRRKASQSMGYGPEEILRREFSLDRSSTPFDVIGIGSCGIVLSLYSILHVFKCELVDSTRPLEWPANPENTVYNDLWNDLLMHQTVYESFSASDVPKIDITVPRCYGFLNSCNHEFWESHGFRFPKDYRKPRNVIVSERIPPLSRPIRNALIDLYFPPASTIEKEAFNVTPKNRDCLVRVYLGKRGDTSRQPTDMFTLRNYSLCVNQMEDLGLDIMEYAQRMADALAVMHWHAQIDADDVEFVLGGRLAPPVTSSLPSAEELKTWLANTHSDTVSQQIYPQPPGNGLWLLDFNRCHEIDMDQTGVDQAVKAFCRNDPYYPRPLTRNVKDEIVWRRFRDRYLETSAKVVGEDDEALPMLFITGVFKEMKVMLSRKENQPEVAPEA